MKMTLWCQYQLRRFASQYRRLFVALVISGFLSPLYAYEVVDSFGKHEFQAPPKRVVVTDWTLLEQLLEMGVEPVGGPELSAYRTLVKNPPLPDGIVDIGLRRSPSITTIKALKPDLIILGTDQKQFDRPFSRIARVMYYQNFSERFASNGEKAQQRFLQLATLFQKTQIAETRLRELEQILSAKAAQINQHFGEIIPPVTIVRLISSDSALVYGEHSMPGYASGQLGLSSEMPIEKSKLGEEQVPVASLQQIQSGYLLYLGADQHSSALSTIDWQTLPAVEANRAIALDTVWSYGGAMSLQYNAEAISRAIIRE